MTTNDILLCVAIALILIALVGMAAAETALSRTTRVKARALADEHKTRAAEVLVELVDQPERFVNPLLVTVTTLQTAQAFLSSIVAARFFGPLGVVGVFIINVLVFFVFAESMPKTWALLNSDRAALMLARPTAWLISFPPLRLVSRGLIGLANVLLPGKGLKQGPFVSEQELLGIVEAAAEDEVIEHEERELIESIIEFGDTVAREIMVPRPDMVIVPHQATVSEALDLAIEHGFSRLPVFNPDDNDIVGIANAKDLIRAERDHHGGDSVHSLLRPVSFVPETKPVATLMREMQADKYHMVIVADEYGDIEGLATLEDCLEELVGEIIDEYDTEDHDVEYLDNGDLIVDGGLLIDELNELTESDLPDDDWDTIGGLMFGTLGQVVEVGDELECGGFRFTAVKVEGRRVRKVRVHQLPPPPPDETDDEPPTEWSSRLRRNKNRQSNGSDEPADDPSGIS